MALLTHSANEIPFKSKCGYLRIDKIIKEDITKVVSYSPIKNRVHEMNLPNSISLHGSTMNLDIHKYDDEENSSQKERMKISILKRDSHSSEGPSTLHLSTLRESKQGNLLNYL
jgi:hypothetical protein